MSNTPSGYRGVRVPVVVRRVSRHPGSAMEFHISGKVHDDYMRDDLATFSKADIVDEIELMRRAGYDEPQIEDIYAMTAHGSTVELPRPIRTTITVLRREGYGYKGAGKGRAKPGKAKRKPGVAAQLNALLRK